MARPKTREFPTARRNRPYLRQAPRLIVLALGVTVACGGESRRNIEVTPTPSSTYVPATPSASATTAPSCPPPAPLPANCPSELLIDFDPRVGEPSASGSVSVEPLQEPVFPEPLVHPPGTPWPDQNPDPATWDRAAVPAGACVFELLGVNAACYPSGGTIFASSCDALATNRPQVAPGSYYDVGPCDVAPGCPSDKPYPGEPGYWWYFGQSGIAENGQVFTDLVICAPECAGSFAMTGGCLRLFASSAR